MQSEIHSFLIYIPHFITVSRNANPSNINKPITTAARPVGQIGLHRKACSDDQLDTFSADFLHVFSEIPSELELICFLLQPARSRCLSARQKNQIPCGREPNKRPTTNTKHKNKYKTSNITSYCSMRDSTNRSKVNKARIPTKQIHV